jgi:hypothetical protein
MADINWFTEIVNGIRGFGEIPRQLVGIRESIDKHSELVSQATEAAREQKYDPLPIPLPVRAELQIPEAEKTKQRKREDRAHGVQVWLASVTTLAFIAAAIYAGVAACQLKATRQQTLLLQQQLEAATACIMSREFRITWPDHKEAAYLSIIMQNKGKVTCSSISADFQMSELQLPGASWKNSPILGVQCARDDSTSR